MIEDCVTYDSNSDLQELVENRYYISDIHRLYCIMRDPLTKYHQQSILEQIVK
jgi:hypothetical protein